MMKRLATHPNVGGVLLVSLGCEEFNRDALRHAIIVSGRPVEQLIVHETGGTRRTIAAGSAAVERIKAQADLAERVEMPISELVAGTICGGSDGTSGITANPAVGRCFDRPIDAGATCMFEETGELIGCEHIMAARASRRNWGRKMSGPWPRLKPIIRRWAMAVLHPETPMAA